MDIIKKISVYIAKYMAIIVVVVAALAFLCHYHPHGFKHHGLIIC